MALKDYSIEEMKEEIDKRLEEGPPSPMDSADFSGLKNLVVVYVEGLTNDSPFDTQYIVECAVESVYGDDIYDYINSIE